MFLAALQSGDLRRVRRIAAQLPTVSLSDAARILALIRTQEPEQFERAAVRWMARYATERANSVDDLGRAVDVLDMMREDPGAYATLRTLAG